MGKRVYRKHDAEKWEKRELGAAEQYAEPSSQEESDSVDSALGLQLISIRLQANLIEELKELAVQEGLGYQPLMRMVLTRYVKENEHRLVSRNRKGLRQKSIDDRLTKIDNKYGAAFERLADR